MNRMNFVEEIATVQNRFSLTNLLPEIGEDEMRKEILAGLAASPMTISSKYFYDAAGSSLFEEITHLDEYYLTRTEKEILNRVAADLMTSYAGYDIIELGSGDSSKISILFSALDGAYREPVRYLPLDISQSAMTESALGLTGKFAQVTVEGYLLDFTSQFGLVRRKNPAMICFFGSTIGNLEWESALELLGNLSRQMKPGDVLLLGMDLLKPEEVLHAAYNDAGGLTEAFNRNILNTVNDLVQSDFNPETFDHLAFFNREKSRMEMHLVSNRNQAIRSPLFEKDVWMKTGEHIHTENSHKYTLGHMEEIARVTGLKVRRIHTDMQEWFAIVEFRKEGINGKEGRSFR